VQLCGEWALRLRSQMGFLMLQTEEQKEKKSRITQNVTKVEYTRYKEEIV
jgi:hypothetical protein